MTTQRYQSRSRRSTNASDLEERTLGTGDPNSPSQAAGKQKARWAQVNLSGGGSAPVTKEYDVIHDLGQVATVCELKSWENASDPTTFLISVESRKSNWSHTHCHVNIRCITGKLDGCVAHFLVQGA